jgi:3-oxoacyl-[acyl-carrier-protein] synthase-3
MGITDFAIEIPSGSLTAGELSRASGIPEEKVRTVLPSGELSVLAPGQEPWDLARGAVATVLARNNVAPEDIGLVIYAGSAEWGRPFWSPAAKIALEAGIHHAHCYELSNFCNAGMVAISQANDQVKLGAHQAALVIVADPLSRLIDPGTGLVELFNFADGAAAVLISAAHRYEVLGSAHRTDPAWVDYYYGEIRDNEVKIERDGKRDGLGEAFIENFVGLTHTVLEDAKRTVDEVAFFLVTHGNQDLHRQYLTELGAGPERSVFTYDSNGHLGGVDPLLALRRLEDEGRVAAGDLIVVATAGSGFTWGVTAFEAV